MTGIDWQDVPQRQRQAIATKLELQRDTIRVTAEIPA